MNELKDIAIELYKDHDKKFIVSEDTDLVIEGFPRSSNTFVVDFIDHLLMENNKSLNIAHHTHKIANLKLAVGYNKPTIVLIRNPNEAILSNFIYRGKGEEEIDKLINYYYKYYQYVYDHLDHFTICDFKVSTSNINNVIDILNKQYNFHIPTSVNLEKDSEIVKNYDKERAKKERSKELYIRTVGTPTKERELIKEKYTEMIKKRIPDKLYELYYKLINSDQSIKENKYKISIITPSFNNGDSIEKAILSVLSQRYDNFEHIIIDGKSQDNTIDILKKYKHLTWISEPDNGQADAMNKGFKLSSGDIIVYLNCDDIFLDGAFQAISKEFEENDVDLVVGNVKIVNSKGQSFIQDPNIELPKMLEHWEPNAFPYNPVQYFYKRKIQENISFNPNNNYAMDHEFLLEISHKYKMGKISNILGVYYSVDGSKTVEGQKDALSYWSYENFSYVDKFLENYSKQYILDFKKRQLQFFLSRITKQQKEKNDQLNILKQDLDNLSSISIFKHPRKKILFYKNLLSDYHEIKR